MKRRSFFFFAGEASGDIHGESLLRHLRKEFPNARFYGVGGPQMRAAGLECTLPMEKFQVMGFIDVFFALPRLSHYFLSLRDLILKEKPDVVILIDYPGFNLALAKSLKKHGYQGKLCKYICPSVWAWGKKRIPKMEKIFDHLFVTFPFEKDLFDKNKLHVEYVGHPLVHEVAKNHSPPIDIPPEFRVLAVFPGSRKKEVFRNFPTQVKVIKALLDQHKDLFVVVSVSSPSFSLLLDHIVKQERIDLKERIMFIDFSQNYALMKRAAVAIAKSGTITIELALHHVPTVVTYGIGKLDLWIAQNLLKINLPHYCIVNILAQQRIFPELYGPNLTEEALFTHVHTFLSSENPRLDCREKCTTIGKILGNDQPGKKISSTLKSLIL